MLKNEQSVYSKSEEFPEEHLDPVCGMQIPDPESAIASEYKGITYRFCPGFPPRASRS